MRPRSSGVQEFRSSGVQEFRSSGVQEFKVTRAAKLQEKGGLCYVQVRVAERCRTRDSELLHSLNSSNSFIYAG